jgi:hypothetical protein
VARKRRLNVFSLAFLDVMSCGFGAVVLIYLIINHATEEDSKVINRDRLAEVRLLDYQVQTGQRDLFELLEQVEALNQRVSTADARLAAARASIAQRRENFSELEAETLARQESLEALKSDLETREREVERLRALEAADAGGRVRSFVGQGDRQYLTGIRVGGKHILIVLDTSASMLDERIVNVLRRRNMPDERKREAPKWQQAVRTVEWITAQLPLDAHFQIYGFNTQVQSFIDDPLGIWVPVGDGRQLEAAVRRVQAAVPQDGNSLIRLVNEIARMDPLPDNVFLITDSLPTQGDAPPRAPTISGRDRMTLFNQALRQLPARVPMNVILLPMEGDPLAAGAFWTMAWNSGGSFIAPSRDWP